MDFIDLKSQYRRIAPSVHDRMQAVLNHGQYILGPEHAELEQRLAKMDLHLNVSPAALEELAKVGFDPVFGARPLKRAIQQRIENPLSKLILEGRFPPKSEIPVEVDPVREPGVFHFGEQAKRSDMQTA